MFGARSLIAQCNRSGAYQARATRWGAHGQGQSDVGKGDKSGAGAGAEGKGATDKKLNAAVGPAAEGVGE
jgi:hypothetical protein